VIDKDYFFVIKIIIAKFFSFSSVVTPNYAALMISQFLVALKLINFLIAKALAM
jgi:hypothetical protein